MCGIAGSWGEPYESVDFANSMAMAIQHRGPDDLGTWLDSELGLTLVHRRLSILDLSPAGHQPMVSPCGRYVLAYNGEVYNHSDLRLQLECEGGQFNWRGHSDTEILLAGLRHWGVEGCLRKLNGMFAFAMWDRDERKLFLARDRMGEKPLYYGCSGNAFLFGSELKALTAHPKWQGEIDRDALVLFMRYNHVPGPHCIYRGINKLPPAHYVVISEQGRQISAPKCFWSLSDVSRSGMEQAVGRVQSVEALSDELDILLRNAVGMRMQSDVPFGAFLSGGYDSTMIVAQMQAQSARPVKTFTIGNVDVNLDEAKHAAAVALHLGSDHTVIYVTAQDALAVIPKLPLIYDEPFADSSQIPTFLVSELASREVKVALSGDGGDELFGGYNRHVIGPGVWRNANRIPLFMRRCIGKQLSRAAGENSRGWLKHLPSRFQYPSINLKLSKLAFALKAERRLEFYDLLRAHWKETDLVLGGSFRSPYFELGNFGLLEEMIFQDMQTYLPDDILTKVDRASMAVSLEVRVPFLDHRLIEFAWRVPAQFKVRDGNGKWLMRELLSRYVPRELMERPKQGFEVPIGKWLRGPLRDWAESLLDESRLKREGYLNAQLVRFVWQSHLAGQSNREHDLWCVLMFQSWLETKKG